MHQGMGLDRMNALGRHRSRIKLGNIFIEEHLNGLLASNSGYQNQCFFVWLIELQLWHGLCSRAFVPGIRSDLNEIIRRVDQALIGSLSRAMNRVHRWVSVNFLSGYGPFVERRSHAFLLLLPGPLSVYLHNNP